MEVSLERLYHFSCDHCQKWWSVADIPPVISTEVTCPHCRKKNMVASVKDPKNLLDNLHPGTSDLRQQFSFVMKHIGTLKKELEGVEDYGTPEGFCYDLHLIVAHLDDDISQAGDRVRAMHDRVKASKARAVEADILPACPSHMQEYITYSSGDSWMPKKACCHCGKDEDGKEIVLEDMPMDEYEKAIADIKQG